MEQTKKSAWAAPHGLVVVLAMALFALLDPGTAGAEESPSAAMMQPVRQLVAFMSTLPTGRHATMFATHDVCIVENFAPFVFKGRNAVARWESGFRAHAAELTDLAASFDAAHDFSAAGNRVYFALPTTWTGRDGGRPFEEHGVWAFVLEKTSAAADHARWRIVGYGWGVSAYSESPQ
jgi:hypothetical protein